MFFLKHLPDENPCYSFLTNVIYGEYITIITIIFHKIQDLWHFFTKKQHIFFELSGYILYNTDRKRNHLCKTITRSC